MRYVVLDTETTGLDPDDGHKIIEIGCIEIINRKVTDNTFHKYINPLREIDIEASKVHGLTASNLSDKPLFNDVYDGYVSIANNNKKRIKRVDANCSKEDVFSQITSIIDTKFKHDLIL